MGLYPQHIPTIPPLFLVAAERCKLHRRHGTWSARKAHCPKSPRPTADSLDSIDPPRAPKLNLLLLQQSALRRDCGSNNGKHMGKHSTAFFCAWGAPIWETQFFWWGGWILLASNARRWISTNQLNKQSQMDETTPCTFVIGDSSTRWSMEF